MTLQLENYGVSELSHSEQQETDGGIIPVVIGIVVGIGMLLSSCQSGNGNQIQVGGKNNKQTTSADSSKASADSSSLHLHGHVSIPAK